MTYQTAAAEALAAWREAEARMDEAEPQGPEWQAAYAEAQRAKTRYHEAVEAASAADQADLPWTSIEHG